MGILASLGAMVLAVAAVGAQAQDTVVYHIDNTATQALKGLRNVRNHLDVDPGARITVVSSSRTRSRPAMWLAMTSRPIVA